jgi:hypothetical protein
MPPEEFIQRLYPNGRPDHTDLEKAAVRGADSLSLQEMDPTVKPVVKMTAKELAKLQDRIAGKVAVITDGTAYVIDPQAIDPLDAISAILSGDDSEALGYPSPGPCDCAVTKQGDVITDIPTMKRHADTNNLIWGASGQSLDLLNRANKVSQAIRAKSSPQGENTEGKEQS